MKNLRSLALVAVAVVGLGGCSGSTASGPVTPEAHPLACTAKAAANCAGTVTPSPTPRPDPSPAPVTQMTVQVSATQPTIGDVLSNGTVAAITIPAIPNGSGTLTVTAVTVPTGMIAAFSVVSSTTLVLPAIPGLGFALPEKSSVTGTFRIAYQAPGAGGTQPLESSTTVVTGYVMFPASGGAFTLQAGQTYTFALYNTP
jgi:hypothetical protein